MSTVPGSPNQLSAQWFPPILNNGNITEYTVYCSNASITPIVRTTVNGTTLAATITGLDPYIKYDCYVTAKSSDGEGSKSCVSSARTDESSELTLA